MKTPYGILLPFACAAVLAITPALFVPARANPGQSDVWPGSDWAESSPEAQGMSSNDLADALEFARTHDVNIHSLTVVRNGVLVLDVSFYPFAGGMRHDLASATKSVVSMLVGIAIGEGRLSGVEQPIIDALHGTAPRGLDPEVKKIRLGDLLSMQSGLDCGFTSGEQELHGMTLSKDWVAYALGLPVIHEPGDRFGYCSPDYHLLSAALSAATGKSAFEYARERLFRPLGIEDAYWPADPNEISHGWGDLQLRPRDMARIGLLMLRGGRWEDRQVVPASWVDSSRTVHALVRENEDYGLGWWISRRVPTLFEANGRGGQRISIVPDRQVVVVMTGGGFEPGDIGRFLLTALRSDTALPEDPRGQARLREETHAIAKAPAPHAVVHSATAGQVSNRTYELAPNPPGIKTFSMEFSDSARAVLRLRLPDSTELVQPLGLDGVYRMGSDPSGAESAGRGEWMPDGRFHAEFNRLARINRFVLDVEFRGNEVRIDASEPTELGTVQLRGKHSGKE